MPSTLTLIPSARRLMDSLRDIGYELPAAVADLVDNSIDADATRVDIAAHFEGEASWIRIADDGKGMLTERLNEAMRYGTDRDYREVELGKFGLGLKTASLSQCRCFTVATRTNHSRREIEIRRWDLDHVMDSDSWQLLRLSTSEVREQAQRSYRTTADSCPESSTEADDPRLRTAQRLVGLVIGGCESVLREELADEPLLLQRVLDRYERMRARFGEDLLRSAADHERGVSKIVNASSGEADRGRIGSSAIAS